MLCSILVFKFIRRIFFPIGIRFGVRVVTHLLVKISIQPKLELSLLMKRFLLILFICVLGLSGIAQQTIGFVFPKKNQKKVSFKFEMYNNLIVIPVSINNFLSMKFIVDTGAEATVLTEKAFGDLVGLNYVREIHIAAPGIRDSVEAYVATNVTLGLPEGITGERMSMLVLKEDYLGLQETLGDEIYGIIGYDIFKRFVVEIDYDDRKLTLHNSRKYKPRKYFEAVDISLDDTKPYIRSNLTSTSGIGNSVKLMVDTGASHALLLDVHNTDDLSMPEETITARLGQGLGGEISGMIGRLNKYEIGRYGFDQVLVSIPYEGSYSNAIKRGSRHGTVGGELLSRFNPTFDYFEGKLYLAKSKSHTRDFEFDMSGMTLGVKKEFLDSLVVRHIKEDSPAGDVGIQEGDRVLSINGKSLYNSKLSELNALLRKKDGLLIKIRVYRDGNVHRYKFRLKRMI